MNISLSIVIFAEIFLICIQIDAVKSWKWGWKSKRKRWNRRNSETDQFCSRGQCVEAWRCPHHFTGSCAQWNSEPMVCCVHSNDEGYYNADETHIYPPTAANDYFKPFVWKHATVTDTEYYDNNGEGYPNTPGIEDVRDRTLAVVRATPISSLGDVFRNFNNKYTTHKPYKKATSVHHDDKNKRTHFPQVMSSTHSWHKQPTPDSRIVFPTESVWMSKTAKYPALTTKVLRTYDKSPSSTSTLTPWGYATKKASVTKYLTLSTKSTRSTTTSAPWRYSTKSIYKTTSPPYNSVATTSYESEKKKNESWGKSTRSHPTKRQNLYPRSTTRYAVVYSPKTTKKSSVTPFPTRTTKRSPITQYVPKATKNYRSTTALPDVNEIACGYRNSQSTGRRERRNYNHKDQPIGDVYSDFTGQKHRLPYERIVGGEEAEPFSWPWVVALYKVTSSGGNRFLSAGSLINENFVLTAAHVFTPDDLRTASYVVMLGTHNAEDAVAEYLVSSVLQHPRYEHRYYYHDIALLKLNTPVTFNNYVMPVCLPSPSAQLLSDKDLEGKNVTVMGWGDESFGGKSSRVLKEATFPIVSRVSCNTSYIRVASNRFPKGITSDMLCAGDPNGGKDACQGDSGGPLTSIANGRHTQVGIVSFGYKCGDKEYPGVYTKVAPYLNWIAENIRRDGDGIYYY